MIMNAMEASDLSFRCREENVKDELVVIEKGIKQQCSRGENYLICPSELSPPIVKVLKELGYTVSSSQFENGSHVSW